MVSGLIFLMQDPKDYLQGFPIPSPPFDHCRPSLPISVKEVESLASNPISSHRLRGSPVFSSFKEDDESDEFDDDVYDYDDYDFNFDSSSISSSCFSSASIG